MIRTFLGWTIRQWSKAAWYHEEVMGHAPTEDPLLVMDTWTEHRCDDPEDPSPIVLVNVLGQTYAHAVDAKYSKWARLMLVRELQKEGVKA